MAYDNGKINKDLKNNIRKVCKEKKIANLTAEYDGEGDSGSINSICATNQCGEDITNILSDEERADIEEFFYDVLPGGWEINEGSFGTATWEVAKNNVKIESNERIVETEYREYNEEI
jgi:hypothetical protein